jgi:hypothetical protein
MQKGGVTMAIQECEYDFRKVGTTEKEISEFGEKITDLLVQSLVFLGPEEFFKAPSIAVNVHIPKEISNIIRQTILSIVNETSISDVVKEGFDTLLSAVVEDILLEGFKKIEKDIDSGKREVIVTPPGEKK